jgi:hypothetical protein
MEENNDVIQWDSQATFRFGNFKFGNQNTEYALTKLIEVYVKEHLESEQ